MGKAEELHLIKAELEKAEQGLVGKMSEETTTSQRWDNDALIAIKKAANANNMTVSDFVRKSTMANALANIKKANMTDTEVMALVKSLNK